MKNKTAIATFFALALSINGFAAGNETKAVEETAHFGYWHCTAYPEGHGHDHGFTAVDEHRYHARREAMMICEEETGHHCHDIHCHFHHDHN